MLLMHVIKFHLQTLKMETKANPRENCDEIETVMEQERCRNAGEPSLYACMPGLACMCEEAARHCNAPELTLRLNI